MILKRKRSIKTAFDYAAEKYNWSLWGIKMEKYNDTRTESNIR